MNGKVSVIIPCFQAEEFLEECLTSVVRQSFRRWELIAINDGSTDRTQEILDAFEAKHPERLIRHHALPRNMGVAECRNKGIDLASGEFIAFLDADDYYAPHHLESMVDALQTTGADLAFSKPIAFERRGSDGQYERILESPNRFPKHLDWEIFTQNFLVPSTAVVRRLVFARCGNFRLHPSFSVAEDADMWLRCCEAGLQFHLSELASVYYRRHGSNVTGRLSAVELARRRVLVRRNGLRYSFIPLWLRLGLLGKACLSYLRAKAGRKNPFFWDAFFASASLNNQPYLPLHDGPEGGSSS